MRICWDFVLDYDNPQYSLELCLLISLLFIFEVLSCKLKLTPKNLFGNTKNGFTMPIRFLLTQIIALWLYGPSSLVWLAYFLPFLNYACTYLLGNLHRSNQRSKLSSLITISRTLSFSSIENPSISYQFVILIQPILHYSLQTVSFLCSFYLRFFSKRQSSMNSGFCCSMDLCGCLKSTKTTRDALHMGQKPVSSS